MKTLKRAALLLSLIFVSLNGFAENQNINQHADIFAVNNMTCKMCHITVRKAIEQVEGVMDAQVDYETKTATVIYDPSQTNPEAIELASANAGYPAKLIKKKL